MQQSDLPTRFPIPFGSSAGASYIRTVPKDPVTPSGSDAPASLAEGFPPETFLPESSGGIPPNGKDFNGILNQITAAVRWLQAGGPALFNSSFAASIGGYPKGAVLLSASTPNTSYISTVDNNTTDPDGVGAAGWRSVPSMEGLFNVGKGYLDIAVAPEITFRINWGKKDLSANSASTDTFAEPYSLLFGVWHGGGTTDPSQGYRTAAWPGTAPNTNTTVNLLNGTSGTLTVHWVAMGLA